MSHSSPVFFLLLLACPAAAQSVSATLTTTTPVVAIASSSVLGASAQQSVPANTAGLQNLLVGSGGANAASSWFESVFPTEVQVSWLQQVGVQEPAPSFAGAGGELLFHLAAPVSTPVLVECSRLLGMTPGALAPACSIDIGDDGVVEMTGLTSASISALVVLGPQPLPIRLRSVVTQIGPGEVDLELRLRVVPQNSLVISPVGAGCDGTTALLAAPSFVGTGVRFQTVTQDPVVLVLGLGVQPTVLPAPFPLPCLLLPSPDLLVLLMPGQDLTLPLPAAVRPVTLWAQGVALTAAALATTNGFWLWAQ